MHMLEVGKPTTLILSVIVFLFFFKTEAQDFEDQGEGKVIVEEFLSLDQFPDLSKPYQTYTFYIKNFKVLREEPKIEESPQINLDSLGNKKPVYDENGNVVTVSHSMTASVRETKYLLDLKSKTAFVICHKKGKTYYYKTEMKDFGEDMYRFFLNISKVSDYKKIEFSKSRDYIAGNFCEEGLLDLNLRETNKNFIRATLWLTRNKTPLKTPLDNMFNESSPFSVLSASYPTAKGNGGLEGYIISIVKEIKEQKIPDEKFELPSDAIELTEVEWENYQIQN